MRFLFILIAASSALCGCSTRYEVSEITGIEHGAEIDGVPFRTKLPQTLRVYRRDSKGKFSVVHTQRIELADTTRLYTIGINANVLADTDLSISLNEDGTLKSTGLKNKLVFDEVATDLSGSITKTADALAAERAARDAARSARRAEQEAQEEELAKERLDQENAVFAATEAFYAAEALIARLLDLPADASPTDVAALTGQVEVAKANANLLAQRAGLTPPY
ncbi:MAG: hypothetical protein AAF581_15680 [Planctomycetota bacterium]